MQYAIRTSGLCHYSFEEHEERGCFSLPHIDNTFPQLPCQIRLLNHSCVDMHNGQTMWCNSKTAGVEHLVYTAVEFGGLIAAWIKLSPGDWMTALGGCTALDANSQDTSFQFLSVQRKPSKVLQHCSWCKPKTSQWGKTGHSLQKIWTKILM